MKTNTFPRLSPSSAASRPPTREQVHALAHELWKERGCPVGRDAEILQDAERQLGAAAGLAQGERIDLDTSEAARVDQELDRMVSPPAQRSPTAL